MLVLDDTNSTLIIDNIHTPIGSDYFWVLDLAEQDYMLTQFSILEEIQCPTLEVMIKGFRFMLPANWYILVVDEDTQRLDVAELSEIAGKEHKALVYGANKSGMESEPIQVLDYFPSLKNVSPALSKNQMLCHPISLTSWINISPTDPYNKFLKNVVSGDLY